MIEPILSLALAVQSNRGVYALLLGSGISRSAQIPTGWEVVEDLIRKLARLRNEDCGNDPARWYSMSFGASPGYSDLLRELATTPAERRQLLQGYFEPTPDERERGIKLPTGAHKAIARLVAKGYIRVIVTTNFDRLLENALEAEGINPTVLSTPDAIEGSVPLIHIPCLVLKLHGDYMDTRIRNTPDELSVYDERFKQQLDRIFDEFGLIVSGWSAEWDSALRSAIERCPNRRFTTFWTVRGELKEEANALINLRQAHLIRISSADDFFRELASKVDSLEQLDSSHPVSAKLAAAIVKRLVVDPRYRIDLADLVNRETERVIPLLLPENFSLQGPVNAEELETRLARYGALAETLLAIFTTGCYWGTREHDDLWVRSLERSANPFGPVGGVMCWINLKRYPTLFLMYAGGLAALAAGKYRTFLELLSKPKIRGIDSEEPLVSDVHAAGSVLDWNLARLLPSLERHKTPVSDLLFTVLREPLREFVPDDINYSRLFNRFEYMLALVFVDLSGRGRAPVGRFMWNEGNFSRRRRVAVEIETELAAAGGDWPLLQAGFCGGSVERFTEVKAALDDHIRQVEPQMW